MMNQKGWAAIKIRNNLKDFATRYDELQGSVNPESDSKQPRTLTGASQDAQPSRACATQDAKPFNILTHLSTGKVPTDIVRLIADYV
jgi:hypothetical protein